MYHSRRPIGDDNDQQRLPQLPLPGRVEEHGLQDLLIQSGTEGGETAEPDLGDDLAGLAFRGDVVALRFVVKIRVSMRITVLEPGEDPPGPAS